MMMVGRLFNLLREASLVKALIISQSSISWSFSSVARYSCMVGRSPRVGKTVLCWALLGVGDVSCATSPSVSGGCTEIRG
jgi:hypothetical protein